MLHMVHSVQETHLVDGHLIFQGQAGFYLL